MHKDVVVIKIGTGALIDEKGDVRGSVLDALFDSIQKKVGDELGIIVVTSGAVATGRYMLADSGADRRIAAAVGQPALMDAYTHTAERYKISIAEILLSRPHLVEREHFLKLQQTIGDFFDRKIIPIINENDALVADSEWSFGDNDSLAAALAIAFDAKKLILVTHIDGLYTADPTEDTSATLIKEVKDITLELMRYCSDRVSEVGRGGMMSKLKAARICTNVGIATHIINGTEPDAIAKTLEGVPVGTVCLPVHAREQIKNKERWILAAKISAASIEVDPGAERALKKRKSLLAVGIKKIYGSFSRGESVEIVNMDKEGIAFGISDVDSDTLLETPFGEQHGVQVMHANNILVFGNKKI
jgi:glutamate 5-kinase